MKKSSKILGSVALSAALVMGTAAPAFAAPKAEDAFGGAAQDYSVNGTDATIDQDGKGASTIVTVSTYTSQLNVTVPLYLPIWLDTAGGTGVSPDNYQITNGSPIEVTVDRAEYTLVHKTLGFSSNLTGVTNKFNIDIAPKDVAGDTLKMDGASPVAGQANKFAQGDLKWTIGKKGATGGADVMKFNVTANSSPLSQRLSDETLASVVYTVKAGDASKAPHEGDGTGTPSVTTNPAPDLSTLTATSTVADVKALFTATACDYAGAVAVQKDGTALGSNSAQIGAFSTVTITNAADGNTINAGDSLTGIAGVTVNFLS